MILELPAQPPGGPDMALIPIRSTCESGEICPTLIYDTDTGDALVQAYLDPDAEEALSVPAGEGVVRIRAHQVARLLYDLNPDSFTGEVAT
jgi:hypothetical protein